MTREVTENWKVVSRYPDQEAIDDGFLVVIDGGEVRVDGHRVGTVNRVTRAVFDEYTEELAGVVTDCTKLLGEVIPYMVKQPLKDGWRIGEWTEGEQTKKLWLLPNEVDGYTLMFPSDY